jgi:hypothetical protein
VEPASEQALVVDKLCGFFVFFQALFFSTAYAAFVRSLSPSRRIPMSILLIFYAMAVLIIAAVAVFVYRWAAAAGRMPAIGLSVASLLALVMLWPIPIHGGFMFLGETLYRELRQWLDKPKLAQVSASLPSIEGPLVEATAIDITGPLSENWQAVLVYDGLSAWYDSVGGMLWSDWLALDESDALPSLEVARARCARHPPAGHWSLAGELENYWLWKGGGQAVLPSAPVSSVSFLDDGLGVATYQLRTTADNRRLAGDGDRVFVVRCVARGPRARSGGYWRHDIPLDEWNRFQLLKITD